MKDGHLEQMWTYISSEKNCSSLFIKATAVCDRNQFGNVGSNKTYAYKYSSIQTPS